MPADFQPQDDTDAFGLSYSATTYNATAPLHPDVQEGDAWAALRSNPNASLSQLAAPKMREEWMTVAPSQERKTAVLDYDTMQQSVSSFSRRGMSGPGDSSGWTATPNEPGQPLTGVPSTAEMAKRMAIAHAQEEARLKAEQARLQQTTLGSKPKSLLEVHQQLKMDERKHEKEKKRDKDKHKDKDKYRDKYKDKDKHKKDKYRDKKDKHKDKDKERKSSSSSSSRPTSTSSYGRDDSQPSNAYWDRDRDLTAMRFAPDRKKQMLRDASMLSDRFASGNK
jgi:hypothetical protein